MLNKQFSYPTVTYITYHFAIKISLLNLLFILDYLVEVRWFRCATIIPYLHGCEYGPSIVSTSQNSTLILTHSCGHTSLLAGVVHPFLTLDQLALAGFLLCLGFLEPWLWLILHPHNQVPELSKQNTRIRFGKKFSSHVSRWTPCKGHVSFRNPICNKK